MRDDMKTGQPADQRQQNYAYKRMLYDLRVAAHSLNLLPWFSGGSPPWSCYAITALIMARNINDFLFPPPKPKYKHDDDIFVVDFALQWKPRVGKIPDEDRERINKIAGHIVADEPKHFSSMREMTRIVRPLISEGRDFVHHCRVESKVSDTGYSKKYLAELNTALHGLGIPSIP